MGALYSKLSGRSGTPAVGQDVDPSSPSDDTSRSASQSGAGDGAVKASEEAVSLGVEATANGESGDSLVSSTSAASFPRRQQLLEGEEKDADTDDTEGEDVQNASLAVHPSTDETIDNVSSATSEPNGHSPTPPPSKAETVATWAQVVAGMAAAPPVAPPEPTNDTDEMESVTSDDSSSVNSSEVNGRHRSSANGGHQTRQRSATGKRSSSSRTSTPTTTPSKRLRASNAEAASASPAARNGTPDSERPFACRAPGCQWAFKALFHLNRHRKTVHGFNVSSPDARLLSPSLWLTRAFSSSF